MQRPFEQPGFNKLETPPREQGGDVVAMKYDSKENVFIAVVVKFFNTLRTHVQEQIHYVAQQVKQLHSTTQALAQACSQVIVQALAQQFVMPPVQQQHAPAPVADFTPYNDV